MITPVLAGDRISKKIWTKGGRSSPITSIKGGEEHMYQDMHSRDKTLLELFSMANRSKVSRGAAIALLLGLLIAIPTGVKSIGACYGRLGNNLPQPGDVVSLYKSNNIGQMRIYDPYSPALQALKGSNIQLILDVPKTDLQNLASDASAANDWVQNNIKAYSDVSFKYIAVGNEVIPGDQAKYVLPAMRNIYSALSSAGLQNQIKVSTAVATSILEPPSSPPSTGAFSSDALTYLSPIVQFLASNGAPLLVNVYPYFSYVDSQGSIDINFALFTSSGTVVHDGQYNYQNLFDAIVDAVYAALEKVGGSSVEIVVSESGWPSAGGQAASIDNAKTYNQNLINHVGQGTPRRSGKAIETYIFEMFNENQKDQGVEQNFGLFYPNMQPVYPINFA